MTKEDLQKIYRKYEEAAKAHREYVEQFFGTLWNDKYTDPKKALDIEHLEKIRELSDNAKLLLQRYDEAVNEWYVRLTK